MSDHWQNQREGGNRFWLGVLVAAALRFGHGVMRRLLYLISLYYFLRRGPERRASREYLTRLFGRRASFWQVFKHVHYFAVTMLDRIYLLAHGERDFDIEVTGLEQLQHYVAQGCGVLLVGSHQGSFEVLRALAARCPEVPLRVLLDKQKTPAITELLEALAPDVGEAVIDVSQGGAAITLAMAETCRAGGMVALLADRGRAHETLRRVDFLGEPAPFPIGPWLLASTLQVPVILCFGLYRGGRRYALSFELFTERVDIPRESRHQALDQVLRRYAQRLEYYARKEPYNWFNFYDFWQQDTVQPQAVTARTVHEA
ncbi:acyltransferase [Dyella nitratireducens]|uniref:Acyltransferase n=1 Tax=Dyella nitratireducens TaxID=1849580 RepID=A0ABQ1FSA9_9GAMM|nr:acyltransferase [Dyella nitratireducens]GGA28480.1 acyltransferase [Dyella nitratireducens]GLQ43277.1 acyltransferase [Dyella nitratireducens]